MTTALEKFEQLQEDRLDEAGEVKELADVTRSFSKLDSDLGRARTRLKRGELDIAPDQGDEINDVLNGMRKMMDKMNKDLVAKLFKLGG